MKNKIRPIYSELQGYLSQAPKLESPTDISSDSTLWSQVNSTISELNNIPGISSKSYDNFKLNPEFRDQGGITPHYFIRISTYRLKLGGLIAKLHAEYFQDEATPFSGMPTTVINQSQQQNQFFQVQMLLEIQGKIYDKIPHFDKDSKEGNFLEKLKNSLSTVKDISQLITLILRTGQDFGLTLSQILNILK